jgi:hypothetical protein
VDQHNCNRDEMSDQILASISEDRKRRCGGYVRTPAMATVTKRGWKLSLQYSENRATM